MTIPIAPNVDCVKKIQCKSNSPRCIVIAGPNGSGKTTFAREFLTREGEIVHFVNADLIAGGLAPLNPQSAFLAAGKILIRELDRLASARESFSFESTLSGLGYLRRLKRYKSSGYQIEFVYLMLDSPQLALRRIASRVKQGGHNVTREDVLRRFERSWVNFVTIYRPIADRWSVYDNSGSIPRLVDQNP